MKNIIKSFFLVALAALMLFSCTNVNDPTAVLGSNGVGTTNKLVGIDIEGLPAALDGQEMNILINGVVVDKGVVTGGVLRKTLSDKAVFDVFAEKNELTLEGVGTDSVTYKLGKYVDDAFAVGFKFEFEDYGYNGTAPEFIFKGKCGLNTQATVYDAAAKVHWWNIAGIGGSDWGTRPDVTVEAYGAGNKYSYTFDSQATTLAGAGVIFAFGPDFDSIRLNGGNIEGDALAAVTAHGVYVWNDSAAKFEKDEEASEDATAITLVYINVPTSEVICPATFVKPQTLVIKNTHDNSELKITNLLGFEGAVDGSNWSWAGGKAFNGGEEQNPKLTSSTGVFVVEATAPTPDWVLEQTPFKDNYPQGFDASIKIKLDGTEAWVPYKVGGKVEFSWLDRK